MKDIYNLFGELNTHVCIIIKGALSTSPFSYVKSEPTHDVLQLPQIMVPGTAYLLNPLSVLSVCPEVKSFVLLSASDRYSSPTSRTSSHSAH